MRRVQQSSERYVLTELPLDTIRPASWLRKFLETQRDGLTGHPEHAGYPYSTQGWAAEIIPPRAVGMSYRGTAGGIKAEVAVTRLYLPQIHLIEGETKQ